jgi:hypothetical protein
MYCVSDAGRPMLVEDDEIPFAPVAGGASFALPRDPDPHTVGNPANSIVAAGVAPLLLFALSRRGCAKIAGMIDGAVEAFDAGVDSLQAGKIRKLIMSEIGIHHSGLLPIVREVVEMFFAADKLAVLVATATSRWAEMPSRAVMFASLVKWGGARFRPPSSSIRPGADIRRLRRSFQTRAREFVRWRTLPSLKKRRGEFLQIYEFLWYAEMLRQLVNIAGTPKFVRDLPLLERLVFIVYQEAAWRWCSLAWYEPPNFTAGTMTIRDDEFRNPVSI